MAEADLSHHCEWLSATGVRECSVSPRDMFSSLRGSSATITSRSRPYRRHGDCTTGRQRMIPRPCTALLLALSACGPSASHSTVAVDAGQATTPDDAGAGAGEAMPSLPSQAVQSAASSRDTPGCPPTMPDVGASCPCAFSCEYGASSLVRCNTLLTGSHGQWTVTQLPLDTGCEGAGPSFPPPGGSCPSERPRIGTACSVPNESCDYGACTGNVNLLCTGGAWEDAPIVCGATTASLREGERGASLSPGE
jgi:hypothetical protein